MSPSSGETGSGRARRGTEGAKGASLRASFWVKTRGGEEIPPGHLRKNQPSRQGTDKLAVSFDEKQGDQHGRKVSRPGRGGAKARGEEFPSGAAGRVGRKRPQPWKSLCWDTHGAGFGDQSPVFCCFYFNSPRRETLEFWQPPRYT